MTCLFDSEVTIDWDFDYMHLYERCVDAALTAENCPYETCVSLLVTDDEGIRQINKDTRSIDKATDVLSFPMLNYNAPSDFAAAVRNSPRPKHPPANNIDPLGSWGVQAFMCKEQ